MFPLVSASIIYSIAYWKYLEVTGESDIACENLDDDYFDCSIDLRDYIHVVITIAIRSAIIAIKYGFYSSEHLKMIRNIVFDLSFQIHDLITKNLLSPVVSDYVLKIQDIMDLYEIDESTFKI